jgi:hypothetical protein
LSAASSIWACRAVARARFGYTRYLNLKVRRIVEHLFCLEGGPSGARNGISLSVEADNPLPLLLMDETVRRLAALLHEAAETHHRVYAIRDGDDPDWGSWYADWLVNLSRLPDLLGAKPIRSELTYLLVKLDKEYLRETQGESWEAFYAARILRHFQSG